MAKKLKSKTEEWEFGAPQVILLEHDQWDARFIGRTADGRQFFLTTPFVPGEDGLHFLALYIFDMKGNLIDHTIDEVGRRSSIDLEHREQLRQLRLNQLGPVSYCHIGMRPFLIQRQGIAFGLIPRPPESDDDGWSASVEPGDYMAFAPPWDYGHYDT